MNTTIEITEQEYLIKLPKDKFNLKFISTLLKRIQAEELFVANPDDDDLICQTFDYDHSARFDHLRDK